MTFSSTFKEGFAGTMGGLLAVVVYVFVGMLFIIPGMFLILKEKKKDPSQRNKSMLILGMVLVGIGSIIALGMGFSLLVTGASTLLE
jgi:hypothetical protein